MTRVERAHVMETQDWGIRCFPTYQDRSGLSVANIGVMCQSDSYDCGWG